MSKVMIQGGCYIADHDLFGTPLWQYTWNDSDGLHVETFTTGGLTPTIGDTIENGVLVPRTIVPNPSRNELQDGWPQPIINNDPGFQKKKFSVPRTWPIDGQDV